MALRANTRATWAAVAARLHMQPEQLRRLYRRMQRIRRRMRWRRKRARGW